MGLKSYTDCGFIIFKIITGGGTFCKPVRNTREGSGGIGSANADISNDKRSEKPSPKIGVSA